jgi:hypothetical protein
MKGTTVQHFIRLIPLQAVSTDEEIAAECALVKDLWPLEDHWRRAKAEKERAWQAQTLGEAATELEAKSEQIMGSTLAPLLFRNPQVQQAWQCHQRHVELAQRGEEPFCDEDRCKAKRGISLRELRTRHSAADIAEAAKHAHENSCPEPVERHKSKDEVSGVGRPDQDAGEEEAPNPGMEVLDARGRPLGENKGDFVSPETARRVRREFDWPAAREEWRSLPPDERRKIEAALGGSIEDYRRHLFAE